MSLWCLVFQMEGSFSFDFITLGSESIGTFAFLDTLLLALDFLSSRMPAPRKRKATDDVEGTVIEAPQKISKKQLRDDARARAIAWAESDNKKDSVDERLKSPTKRRKIHTSSSFSNNQRTKTATATAIETKLSEAATLSNSKLSKKERLEQGKTLALEWAKETQSLTKEGTLTRNAATTVKGPPPKRASRKSLPLPAQTHAYNEEEMHDAVEEAIFQEVIGTKLQPKSHPKPIKDTAEVTFQYNPIAASVHAAERNMVQIQLELEKQIQYQVLENVLKTINPQLQAQQQQQQQMDQHIQPTTYREHIRPPQQQYFQPKNDVNTKRPLLMMSLSVIIAMTAIAFGFHLTLQDQTYDAADLTTAISLPPCFISNQIDPLEGIPPSMNESSITQCDTSSAIAECPDNAVCIDGLLHSCLDPYQIMAMTGDACILSKEANATLEQVQTTLIEWTIQHHCTFQGCKLARNANTRGPVFPATNLLENVDEVLLAQGKDLVLTKDEVGTILVGLSDHYMEHKIVFPWLCWSFLLVIQSIQALSGLILGFLGFCIRIVWSTSVAHPWVSLTSLITLWVLRKYYRRQMDYKVLLNDVAEVRHLAHQKLMSDSLEHVVLHLRDEVALDLHPTSKTNRDYLILKVWPRVVADIRLDNRVHKTTQMVHGKPRDMWQWVATPGQRVTFGKLINANN